MVALVFERTLVGGTSNGLIDGLDASGRMLFFDGAGTDIQIVNGTGNSLVASSVLTIGKYNVAMALLQGPSSWVDGNIPFNTHSGTGDSGTDSGFTGVSVGDAYILANPFTGIMKEVLVWNDPVPGNLPSKEQVRDYLNAKYGVGWPKSNPTRPPVLTKLDTPSLSIVGGNVVSMFGDSITLGSPTSAQRWYNPYVTSVNAGLVTPITVINAGVGGNTYQDLLNRVQTDVIAHSPDVVIVECGLNDLEQQVPIDVFVNNIGKLIDQLRAGLPNVKLMFLSMMCFGEVFPDPNNTVVQQYVDAQRFVCVGRNVPFVDERTPQQAYEAIHNIPPPGVNSGLLTSDGGHPNSTAGTPLWSATAFAKTVLSG